MPLLLVAFLLLQLIIVLKHLRHAGPRPYMWMRCTYLPIRCAHHINISIGPKLGNILHLNALVHGVV